MERAQQKYKGQHDKKSEEPSFEKGTKVWLFCSKFKVGLAPKLCKKWLGPYYIVDLGPKYTYKLRRCSDDKPLKYLTNANRLKKYFDPATRPTNVPIESEEELNPEELEEEQDTEQKSTDEATDDSLQSNSQQQTQSQVSKSKMLSEAQIVKIIKAAQFQGRKSYLIKLIDGSTQWQFTEQIPEKLRKEFHITRNEAGKKRKRPLRNHKFFVKKDEDITKSQNSTNLPNVNMIKHQQNTKQDLEKMMADFKLNTNIKMLCDMRSMKTGLERKMMQMDKGLKIRIEEGQNLFHEQRSQNFDEIVDHIWMEIESLSKHCDNRCNNNYKEISDLTDYCNYFSNDLFNHVQYNKAVSTATFKALITSVHKAVTQTITALHSTKTKEVRTDSLH
ncbi:hypothetical protein SNE40_021414 [Patella caerulea]|uniref:Uncharacterized protein n=1 Tax=Patella caerulea TaxID=87958 RepID=A0AAN8GIQ1_PATCE